MKFLLFIFLTIFFNNVSSYITCNTKLFEIFYIYNNVNNIKLKNLSKKILINNFQKLALYYAHNNTKYLSKNIKKLIYNDILFETYNSLDIAISNFNIYKNKSFNKYLKKIIHNRITTLLSTNFLYDKHFIFPLYICSLYRKINALKKLYNIPIIIPKYYLEFETNLNIPITKIKYIENIKKNTIHNFINHKYKSKYRYIEKNYNQNYNKNYNENYNEDYYFLHFFKSFIENNNSLSFDEKLVLLTRFNNYKFISLLEVSNILCYDYSKVIRIWKKALYKINLREIN